MLKFYSFDKPPDTVWCGVVWCGVLCSAAINSYVLLPLLCIMLKIQGYVLLLAGFFAFACLFSSFFTSRFSNRAPKMLP